MTEQRASATALKIKAVQVSRMSFMLVEFTDGINS